MSIKFYISLMCIGTLLTGCIKSYQLTGPVNADLVSGLNALPTNIELRLASGGGDPDFGEEAAKVIRQKKISLHITGICLSSCAEYLIPAAESLRFENALIGFHQNPIIIDELNKMHSEVYKPVCDYGDNLEYISRVYNSYPRNNIPTSTLERLGISGVEIEVKSNCNQIGFRFVHQFWFPTSEQLRDVFGFEFAGDVCADNIKCYTKVIDSLFPEKASVLVGDDIYFSNGLSSL